MVEGIDERQSRRAIERSPIVQCCGDANRCLVDIWDAKIDFSHVEMVTAQLR